MHTTKTGAPAHADRTRRAKHPRPKPAGRRSLRANAAFALLTVLILAVGGTGAVRLSTFLSAPSGQVESFASLPVYNVIGQRTERVEFWPRARYHDRAQALGTLLPYTPRQAFEENNLNLILQNMLSVSDTGLNPILYLSSRQEDGFACYSYQSDNVLCRFYDQIPIQIVHAGKQTGPVYQGVINSSTGRALNTGRYCYSALITPSPAMEAATEEQYQMAYQTILEHLMQLSGGGHQEAPYYCDGPLVWVLDFLMADFPSAVTFNAEEDSAEAMEGQFAYTYTALEMFYSALLDNFQKNGHLLEVPPWEQISWPQPDSSDPQAMERFLQEYYTTIYGIDLQILRQDGCYLILFQQSDSTLGLYFDPLLQAYTGFGIQ